MTRGNKNLLLSTGRKRAREGREREGGIERERQRERERGREREGGT